MDKTKLALYLNIGICLYRCVLVNISDASWDVSVHTSKKRNSGTDANVYVILMGEMEDGDEKTSDKFILDNRSNNFESGKHDSFKITTFDFANLTKLRIGHDNRGIGSGWHLEKV